MENPGSLTGNSRIFQAAPSFYPVRIVCDEFLPTSPALHPGERVRELVIMAHGNGEGIRRIQEFLLDVNAQYPLQYCADLVLGGGPVPGHCHLGLSRGILRDGDSPRGGGEHCGSLGTAEFQDDLGVLAVERGLQCHLVRGEPVTYIPDFPEDAAELGIGVILLPEIDYAHVQVVWLAVFNTDDPEAKNVGSGVYSEYSCVLYHLSGLVDVVESGVRPQDFRDDNPVLLLVVLKHCRNDAWQGKGTSVEGVA